MQASRFQFTHKRKKKANKRNQWRHDQECFKLISFFFLVLFCLNYTENFECVHLLETIRVTFYFFNYFFFLLFSWHADDCHKYIKRNNKKKRPHEKFKINARVRERFFIFRWRIQRIGNAKMKNEGEKWSIQIKSNSIWLKWGHINGAVSCAPSNDSNHQTKIGEQHNRLSQSGNKRSIWAGKSCILYGVICLMC